MISHWSIFRMIRICLHCSLFRVFSFVRCCGFSCVVHTISHCFTFWFVFALFVLLGISRFCCVCPNCLFLHLLPLSFFHACWRFDMFHTFCHLSHFPPFQCVFVLFDFSYLFALFALLKETWDPADWLRLLDSGGGFIFVFCLPSSLRWLVSLAETWYFLATSGNFFTKWSSSSASSSCCGGFILCFSETSVSTGLNPRASSNATRRALSVQ